MAVLAGGLIFSSCTSKHTITVKSNNDAWGTVTGGGSYNDQEVATLLATPNAGYYFVKWQDNSTENPRSITVTQDETWTAFFEPIPVVNVTFNNSTWDAASVEGAYFAGQHAWDVYAEQTADNYPKADIAMFTGTSTGSFTDQVDAEDRENNADDLISRELLLKGRNCAERDRDGIQCVDQGSHRRTGVFRAEKLQSHGNDIPAEAEDEDVPAAHAVEMELF